MKRSLSKSVVPIAALAAICGVGVSGSALAGTTYTISRIGLTGPNFVGTDPVFGTGVEQNTLYFANAQGLVVGGSGEYTAGTNSQVATAMWAYTGTTTVPIGLLTSQYVNPTTGFVNAGPGSISYNNSRLVSNGFVTGYSTRYDTNGTSLGYDSWIFNGTSTALLPLPSSIPVPTSVTVNAANLSYSFVAPTGGTKETMGGPTNTVMTGGNGSAAGTITDYYNTTVTASGTTWASTGTDAWYSFNGVTKTIGMVDGNNLGTLGLTAGTLFTRSSSIVRINSVGQVLGYSNFYGGQTSSSATGSDVWLYDPNNATGSGANGTQLLSPPSPGGGMAYGGAGAGLTLTAPTFLSDSGVVAAQFLLFASTDTARSRVLSADAWLYGSGTSTWTQVGLSGSAYTYIPSATTGAGTGGSNFGGSGFLSQYPALNPSGQAVGFTKRTALSGSTGVALGQDAWVYYPSGGVPAGASAGTTQIGLLGGAYEANSGTGVTRSTNPIALANDGAVAGVSARYVSVVSTSSAGQDAWYYDPSHGITTSTLIGLTGANYEFTPAGATNNYRSSTITAISQTGLVGGTTVRLPTGTGLSANGGTAAWVYSAATNTTYKVDPTDSSYAAGTKFTSTIVYISDSGVAIGWDDPGFSGGTPPIYSQRLFEWYLAYDSATGMNDIPTFSYLNVLVDPASFTNWAGLYSTIGYAPSLTASGSIVGYGGLTSDNSSSYVPFVISPISVPEPTWLGMLLPSTLGLLRRRR
jgi:hypothetical protein